MNIIKLRLLYKVFTQAAKFLVKDKGETLAKIKQGSKKALENKGALVNIWDQLQLLFSIAKDYSTGSYTAIPKGSIIAIMGGLLYFISPLDLIPDLIPGLGFVDDAYILTLVFKQVGKDLAKYKKWKNMGKDILPI